MDLLHYYLEYRVLVCKSCQYAIHPTHIAAHLRSDQHKLTRPQSQEIADQYKTHDLANPQSELVAPTSIVLPIEHLPIYRDGLRCNHCRYICRVVRVMKRHQQQQHNLRVGRGRRPEMIDWTIVWCQQFFTGVGRHFFQVQQTNQTINSLSTNNTTRLLELVHRQLDQKERIVQEKRQLVRDSEDVTEVSSWLERTQWIRHLEGQDKITMVQLVKPTQTEELVLQEVEKSLVRLVEKAQQTILQKKVSIFTLQRVESFQPGQDAPKPFHVNMIPETKQRYQRVWSQLLLYILRTADLESRLYQLTRSQYSGVQIVLQSANQLCFERLEDLEREEIETIQQELDKYCLELCMRLLD